jgi:hypothetical protein
MAEPDVSSPEWDARSAAASHAEVAGLEAMAATRPTTRVGAVAMITAYLEQRGDTAEATQILLESLAEAIPHLA